jgi:hypothetical protein
MLNQIASRIQSVRLTVLASHLRAGLALISIVALLLGGNAGGHWD